MKSFFRKNWIILLILAASLLLRLYKITKVPVSLFGDELDLGYQAYSILKTGRDYYGNFMPLHFHSIAEFRTPLYLYFSVPTVALFGISALGVRLPAVFFGVLSVGGIYLLTKELLSYSAKPVNFHPRALLAALILAINPWNLEYSRGGFEVTMLLTFLIFGLYFFFKSLKNSKYLWISVVFLTFTPWIYSTAKLFTPLFMIFLFLLWRKDILKMNSGSKISAMVAGLLIGLPIAYSTVFGGGAERASYTSVFTDPTTAPEVGVARGRDAVMRGENTLGLSPTVIDKAFHNKVTIVAKNISDKYIKSLSADFLFVNGDPNLRHSPPGVGEFYKIELLGLILGLIWFFTSGKDIKIKSLIAGWIILGILPAALTRDGGTHATRLILILPPLISIISYGVIETYRRLNKKTSLLFIASYFALLFAGFVFYLHNYYVHYPWDSERWWHYGFKQSFDEIKSIDANYDKVLISMSGEPAWIFFAGWYQYDPSIWQKNFPIGNDVTLPYFGKVSHIDKFYFTSVPANIGIFGLGKIIDNKTLYLANASEIGENLVTNPERGPGNLRLIKAVAFPSGEPAYYIFSGR